MKAKVGELMMMKMMMMMMIMMMMMMMVHPSHRPPKKNTDPQDLYSPSHLPSHRHERPEGGGGGGGGEGGGRGVGREQEGRAWPLLMTPYVKQSPNLSVMNRPPAYLPTLSTGRCRVGRVLATLLQPREGGGEAAVTQTLTISYLPSLSLLSVPHHLSHAVFSSLPFGTI